MCFSVSLTLCSFWNIHYSYFVLLIRGRVLIEFSHLLVWLPSLCGPTWVISKFLSSKMSLILSSIWSALLSEPANSLFTSFSEFFSSRISIWLFFMVSGPLVKYFLCSLTLLLRSLNCPSEFSYISSSFSKMQSRILHHLNHISPFLLFCEFFLIFSFLIPSLYSLCYWNFWISGELYCLCNKKILLLLQEVGAPFTSWSLRS